MKFIQSLSEEEGVFVAEHVIGQKPHIDYNLIPGVVYTWPEVASVGKNEEELKDMGVEYTIRKIRPRVNMDRTGWNKPHSDGMLGQHPLHEETIKFAGQYYSAEEESWLRENA